MNESIQIQLDNNSAEYAPGSAVTGKVFWEIGSSNAEIEVRLFWFTEGRGTQDIEIVDQDGWSTSLQAKGEHAFSLRLPASPLSFSGQLISLQWAIEAVLLHDQTSIRQDIVLSLTGREVILSAVENPKTGKNKKKSAFQKNAST